MQDPHHILLIRTDRIGDVVLTLPAIQKLKAKFPTAKVSFLVREYTLPLVQGNNELSHTFTLEHLEGMGFGERLSFLRSLSIDAAVLFYPTFPLALLLFLAGIKIRIGTGYRWYSNLFNRKVNAHRKFAEKHELEFNLDLLKPLGLQEQDIQKPHDYGLLQLAERGESISFVKKDSHSKYVVVHPGSGGSAVDLPLKRMKEIVEEITKMEDTKVLLTGNGNEIELCQHLKVNERVVNLAGHRELRELITIIAQADLFIGNSTGPLHIAVAVGTPVIGFYPKVVSCSKERWGPYSDTAHVFTPKTECSNCTTEQCAQLNCMMSIDTDEVVQRVREVLEYSIKEKI